jgi:putative MATE family efflux protein
MQRPAAPPNLLDSNRPLWLGLLSFLMPLIGSNLLQALGGTVGNIYLGRMIGVSALAAVAGFFPLLFFMISFLFGLANAATVLIGQSFGAGEIERVRAIAGTSVTINVVVGLVLAVLGAIFAPHVLRLLGTPPDIMGYALDYARIIFYALPILFLYLAYTTFLRGTGDSSTPFYALLLNTAIGLTVTPVLISGWVGLPAFSLSLGHVTMATHGFGIATGLPSLGVSSGAVAATLANALGLVFLAIELRRRGNVLAPGGWLLRHLTIDWSIIPVLFRIGLPTATQMVLVSLSEIAVISFVNAYGSSATAAYGAVNQIVSFVQFPAISVGIAASVFGAQAIGAGETHRLGAIVRTALILNLIICTALIGIVYFFARDILGWFIADPATLALAFRLLVITLWSYVVFGSSFVLSGMMRASGTVLWPTAISIFAIWGVEVPVAWVLSHRIGIEGIWIAYPVAFTALLLLQTTYFRLVWRHRTVTRL